MHYFLLIYFNSKNVHVSSRFAAHHQEDQLCINSNWYNQHNAWPYQLLRSFSVYISIYTYIHEHNNITIINDI